MTSLKRHFIYVHLRINLQKINAYDTVYRFILHALSLVCLDKL